MLTDTQGDMRRTPRIVSRPKKVRWMKFVEEGFSDLKDSILENDFRSLTSELNLRWYTT